MFGKKLTISKPAAMKVTPAPSDVAPAVRPTRPVLHVAANPKTLGAEDPQLLEQALLRRMKRFGN